MSVFAYIHYYTMPAGISLAKYSRLKMDFALKIAADQAGVLATGPVCSKGDLGKGKNYWFSTNCASVRDTPLISEPFLNSREMGSWLPPM